MMKLGRRDDEDVGSSHAAGFQDARTYDKQMSDSGVATEGSRSFNPPALLGAYVQRHSRPSEQPPNQAARIPQPKTSWTLTLYNCEVFVQQTGFLFRGFV